MLKDALQYANNPLCSIFFYYCQSTTLYSQIMDQKSITCHCAKWTVTTLEANSADDNFILSLLFFPENRRWHFK